MVGTEGDESDVEAFDISEDTYVASVDADRIEPG